MAENAMNQHDDASPEQALDVWGRKLIFLQGRLAMASASEEFSIQAEIATARRRIRELAGVPDAYLNFDSSRSNRGPQISIGHLPQPSRHFVGREDELALLDEAWHDPSTNIVQFVAFGGVGKSALVAEWLKRMQDDGWRGAACVLGHSFYSQGAREDAQASADSFLDQALQYFGDPDPTAGSPWNKGERLAGLVREHRTLLILDGVEPLQNPPTSGDAGQIRDPGLSALIRELAAGTGGLCVISTRARVQDIEWLEKTAAKSGPVTTVPLESLSPESGAVLLKQLGVNGQPDQLQKASADVRGHGLALTLLGNFLREACHGDVEARHEIGLLDEELDAGGHARRMMERLELWLAGHIEARKDKNRDAPFVPAEIKKSGHISLELLRLTALFDRPITMGEFAALLKGDATCSGG